MPIKASIQLMNQQQHLLLLLLLLVSLVWTHAHETPHKINKNTYMQEHLK